MTTTLTNSKGGERRGDGSRPHAHNRMKFVVDVERTPGLDLVERLLESGEDRGLELTPEAAKQAIEALEHLQLPWLIGEIHIARGCRGARAG